MSKTSQVNHVHFVIDRSSSMSPFRTKVINQTNGLLKEVPVAIPGVENRVSVTSFADGPSRDIVDGDSQYVEFDSYNPSGMTAIAYTIRQVLTDISEQLKRTDKRNRAWLVYLVTDGDDNMSSSTDILECKKLISALSDKVTLAVFVPSTKSIPYIMGLGVARGNIQVWNVSDAGYDAMSQTTSQSLRDYAAIRASGATATTNLFRPSTASVSEAIKVGDLKEYTGPIRILNVLDNVEIAPFVEGLIGSYTKGTAYYQLTKAEELGATKNVLIVHKISGKTYHGKEARSILGLPNGKTRVSVSKQGGEYDVFIQSTSLNRKLIKGTRLIVLV